MDFYDNGASTQELIIASAKKLFFERGVENTSTRDVADRSHVVRNSVRYYFRTKKDIRQAVSADILNRLVDVTVQKLQLEKLSWVVMSFVFWYRFWEDGQFRNYNLQCVGKTDSCETDYRCVYELMYLCFGGTLDYDDFLKENALALEISWDVQERLMVHYAERLMQADFQEAAANELLLSLRLYGIPDALIRARIEDALELLPSLDLKKMSEALG